MPEVHLDILEEILTRSQVEDLIRCKSVCKSWKSLISSHRFIKSHLNYNRKKKADNNEIGDTRVDLNYDHHLVGSSNGIVCISRFDREFFVVNPSTREVKELRNPPRDIDIQVSGFGYDSSIDDFKVVIVFYNTYSDNYGFKVLTLKSNVWRSVALEVGGTVRNEQIGTLCNGAIHWLFYDQSYRKVIISFDLSKEVIIEILAPKQCNCEWYLLGTIKDRLCIFPYHNIHFKKTEEIEIWVMKNYNVGESWERWLAPPGYEGQKTKMNYNPHYRFLDDHAHIWMLEEGAGAPVLVHSLERPGQYTHILLSTISECNCNFGLPVFMKSLVSLHGMGDDSGNGGRLLSTAMLEEGSGVAVLVHAKSCETLESHTICNKSQRFAKISQGQKTSLKMKVKENANKPLRPKQKARGKTKTYVYVIENEEGTDDMSGDDYDGILDHNLNLVQRSTYTFKDFLSD